MKLIALLACALLLACEKDPASNEPEPNYYSVPNPPSETWLESSSDSSGNMGIIFHWKDNSNNEDGFELYIFDAYRRTYQWKVSENSTEANSLDRGYHINAYNIQRMRSFNRGGWSEWVECRFR